jgi:hypothetical protein
MSSSSGRYSCRNSGSWPQAMDLRSFRSGIVWCRPIMSTNHVGCHMNTASNEGRGQAFLVSSGATYITHWSNESDNFGSKLSAGASTSGLVRPVSGFATIYNFRCTLSYIFIVTTSSVVQQTMFGNKAVSLSPRSFGDDDRNGSVFSL